MNNQSILEIIKPIRLLSGNHADTGITGQGCLMNVIAYLNGESQITDQSRCVCVTIKPIAIFLNDFANDSQRQRLLPYVLRAMGTATDDNAVIKKRLAAVVRFAEFNAQLSAKFSAECAADSDAKYAKYAEYAKFSAEYAKFSAERAKYAKYADSAAKYAVLSAKYAEYAEYAKFSADSDAKYAKYADSAKYAAKAKYAAEYAKYADVKDAIFDAGIEFLEAVCNPQMEADQTIINRANALIALAAV